ncbi:MAG: hypothetical protein NTY75_04945, partial [Candidatus Shapirobacteria bacterium]|nr:hypothetical protein [Candidatus Shapirobacteria bacterium]
MVSKIDTKNLDDETKKVVGLQAVEMVLACLDDQWGIAEDSLLRIPNTWEGGDESNKFLINQYKKIAINCGFSKLIVELLTLFSRVHQLKTKMMLPGDAIELNDLEK